MAVEAPLLRRPAIKVPDKRVRGIRNVAAAAALSVAFIAGCNPSAEATQKPTVTQTETPIFTATPEPTLRPTPTANALVISSEKPEQTINPIECIEKIKLNPEGRLILFNLNERDHPKDKPYFAIYAQNATVVAIEKDEENDLLWIGVSVPGNSVQEKILEADKNDPLSYTENVFTGATLWFNISEETPIIDDTFWGYPVGNGSEVLPYIKVGGIIPNIMATTTYNKDYDPRRTPEEIAQNANTLDDLKSSIGKDFPRSDKRFSFSAEAIVVLAPDLNLNLQQP